MLKENRKKGFSLIELLVAVAILIILTAFLVPSLYQYFDETRMDKDFAKLDSITVAFKRSMGDPAVQKEAEQLDPGAVYVVTFQVDKDGYIDFGKGTLTGIDTPFNQTQLWLNTYQMIGLNYQTEYKGFKECTIVYTITPKTSKTTANCSYEVIEP